MGACETTTQRARCNRHSMEAQPRRALRRACDGSGATPRTVPLPERRHSQGGATPRSAPLPERRYTQSGATPYNRHRGPRNRRDRLMSKSIGRKSFFAIVATLHFCRAFQMAPGDRSLQACAIGCQPDCGLIDCLRVCMHGLHVASFIDCLRDRLHS